MAITQDNVTGITSGGSGATSYTYSHTITSNTNGCLIVAITEDGGTTDDITGVTYAGVSMTLLKKGPRNGTYPVLSVYGLLLPSTGANNIVISRSGTAGDMASGSVSWIGVRQSGLPDANLIANSLASTSVTGSITTIANNAIIVAWAACGGGSLTAGTGTTSLSAAGANMLAKSTTFPITPAGSYSMTVNCSSGSNGLIMVSLAPFLPTNGNFLAFI